MVEHFEGLTKQNTKEVLRIFEQLQKQYDGNTKGFQRNSLIGHYKAKYK